MPARFRRFQATDAKRRRALIDLWNSETRKNPEIAPAMGNNLPMVRHPASWTSNGHTVQRRC